MGGGDGIRGREAVTKSIVIDIGVALRWTGFPPLSTQQVIQYSYLYHRKR